MLIDFIFGSLKNGPSIKRHLLKTITWRTIGSLETAIFGWFITGDAQMGIKIASFEFFAKSIFYFIHERFWERIDYGRPSRREIAAEIKEGNRLNLFAQKSLITRTQRENLNNASAFTIWLTGLSGSGKSTIAAGLDQWLFNNNYHSYVLDGDNTRLGINSDLSFSIEDRKENIRRVAEICRLFNEAGVIVIASFISPFENDRMTARKIIGLDNFILAFIDSPLQICIQRDIKGLYKLANEGKIKDFTGIDSPYEVPQGADLHLPTHELSQKDSTDVLINYLRPRFSKPKLLYECSQEKFPV